MKSATYTETQAGEPLIKITFTFSFTDVDQVKTLPGRRYNGDFKYWTCPLDVFSLEKLRHWGFTLDARLTEILRESQQPTPELKSIDVPGLKGHLFPFQSIGVSFIEAHKGRALIADEMGLGKTIQALAWLQLHPKLRPAVIIVPASLKLNWERECNTWMTYPLVQILSNTNPCEIRGKIIIINYDILPNKHDSIIDEKGKPKEIEISHSGWIDYLKEINPQVLILDEIHYVKNNQAHRTKAVKRLAKGIPHVIGLSGTPIVNRPIEAYNAIHMINPLVMPNFWTYAQRYCGACQNGYGWDFSGATNTEELHEKLTSTIMLRRKKADVLKDLPDKIYSFVPIELDNREEYNTAEYDFIEFLRRTKGQEAATRASNAETLAEIEGLKQLSVKGKMKEAIEWIRNFLEVDGKLVVFAVHKSTIDQLMETFHDVAVKIDGSVSGVERQKAVDRFQTDETKRLFVGNIQAAGVGITLTAASNVVFLELPWTPGALVQAEDRCHRIGQHDSVNIHYLLAIGTIEDKIARLLDKKRQVLDQVLDGVETAEESLLSELMKEYV